MIRRFETVIGHHKLYVEGYRPDHANAAPILCLGGAFDGSWIYRRFMRLMAARGHAIYAMNLRGYYRSRWNHVADLTVHDYLQDIAEVRDALHLGHEAVLVGYSIGGPLVLAEAARRKAAGVVLYDPDPPKHAMREKVAMGYQPPVVKFIPSKDIIEEMWGGPVSRRFYEATRPYFEMSSISGRAYRTLCEEGVDASPSAVHSPVLIIGTRGRNASHHEMFQTYEASWYAFDGFSHGMILFSPHAELLARFAASWVERGMPTGRRRFFFRGKGPLTLSAEDSFLRLRYFTGWSRPRVRVLGRGNRLLREEPMRRIGHGREEGEQKYEARFLLSAGTGFEIAGDSGSDRPAGGGLYRPRGTVAALADGILHPGDLPTHPHAPVRHNHDLRDDALDHTFHVRVFLPRDYPARAPYPLAIFNDGQNVWTREGAYGGWHVDRTATRLAQQGRMRDVIIAGVWCHKARNKAYLAPPIGRADLYTAFLRDRLLPMLRSHYRISSASREIAILGASYGANAAVYIGLTAPETFGLVGSLSYAYLQGSPIEKMIQPMRRLPFRRLYLDCGTRWAHDQPTRDDFTGSTKRMIKIAQQKGMILGFNMYAQIAKDHFHNEEFWRRRMPRAFEFLFPPL